LQETAPIEDRNQPATSQSERSTPDCACWRDDACLARIHESKISASKHTRKKQRPAKPAKGDAISNLLVDETVFWVEPGGIAPFVVAAIALAQSAIVGSTFGNSGIGGIENFDCVQFCDAATCL
jgi:hypothetical protein